MHERAPTSQTFQMDLLTYQLFENETLSFFSFIVIIPSCMQLYCQKTSSQPWHSNFVCLTMTSTNAVGINFQQSLLCSTTKSFVCFCISII